MKDTRILAIILIVAGSLGLIYGGFTYTQDTQTANVGPLELTVKDTKTVNVPIWVGVGTLVAGGLLLVMPK